MKTPAAEQPSPASRTTGQTPGTQRLYVHGRLVFTHRETGPFVPRSVSGDGRWLFFFVDEYGANSAILDGVPLLVVSTRGGPVHDLGVTLPYPFSLAWCGGRARLHAGERPCRHRRKAPRRSFATRLASACALGRPVAQLRHAVVRTGRDAVAVLSQHTSTNASFFATRWRLWRVGLDGIAARCSTSRRPAGRTNSRPGRRTARRSPSCGSATATVGSWFGAIGGSTGLSRSSATRSATTATTTGGSRGGRDASVSSPACGSAPAGRGGRWTRRRSRTCGPRSTSATSRPGSCTRSTRSTRRRTSSLSDGDEVALIPPVSGGAFLLSDEPLSLDRVVAEVRSDEAGAIATFTGTTRVHSRGRTVTHLDYEAYEGMAEQVMEEIADALRARYELTAIAIHHRIGRVTIGETSVVIAVSAAAPPGRARGVQGRDRRAEGARAALEERGLRGRRGVDRPRLLTS